MKTEACLILLLNALAVALRRGPHHPHGQIPLEQKHHHYKPTGGSTITGGDSSILRDIKHIQEDTKVLTEEQIANLSPEEREFYYFSAHDFDKNYKLDGLELLKAVYHTLEHEVLDSNGEESTLVLDAGDFQNYISTVDLTLQSDDKDGDGYISYAEYRAARVAYMKEISSSAKNVLPAGSYWYNTVQ